MAKRPDKFVCRAGLVYDFVQYATGYGRSKCSDCFWIIPGTVVEGLT